MHLLPLCAMDVGLAVTAFSNVQQCAPKQPRLQTVYTFYNSPVNLGCATAHNTPSYWTCTKFDSDGSVMTRETLPRDQSIVTYTASEAGVYEIAQIVPWRGSPKCQCKFEVKVNISAALQSAVLADLDQRYGKLNLNVYNSTSCAHTTQGGWAIQVTTLGTRHTQTSPATAHCAPEGNASR